MKIVISCPDDLETTVLATAIPRELHRQYPGKFEVVVESRYHDLWLHNPYISSSQIKSNIPLIPKGVEKVVTPTIKYTGTEKHVLWMVLEGIAEQLCLDSLELTEMRPCIHLSDEEHSTAPSKSGALQGMPYWAAFCAWSSNSSIYAWDFKKWGRVVNNLATTTDFLVANCTQADRHDNSTNFKLAVNLNNLTLRECIWLIHHSDGVLCGPDEAMHIAAALCKPCVVVAGCSRSSKIIGYSLDSLEHCAADIDDKYEDLSTLMVAQDFLQASTPCKNPCCFNRVVVGDPKTSCKSIVDPAAVHGDKKPSYPQASCMYSISVPSVVGSVKYWSDKVSGLRKK